MIVLGVILILVGYLLPVPGIIAHDRLDPSRYRPSAVGPGADWSAGRRPPLLVLSHGS